MHFYPCCFLIVVGILRGGCSQTNDFFQDDFTEPVSTAATPDSTEIPDSLFDKYPDDKISGKGENVVGDSTNNLGQACTGQMDLTKKSGELFTPNYPDPYPSNTTCIWTIRAPKGHHIYLYFHHFDLEEGLVNIPFGRFSSPECHFDFLYIYEVLDGDRSQQPSLLRSPKQPSTGDSDTNILTKQVVWGVYCGKQAPPPRMTETAGSKVVLIFHTDGSKEKLGFWATFQTITTSDLRNLIEKRKIDVAEDDEWDEMEEYEQGAKRAYAAIVIFVFSVVLLMMVMHCWQGSPLCETLLPANCLPRPGGSDSTQSVWMSVFRQNGGENTSQIIPSLPSPPPPYGEIVKTEEDWQRALERIGETEESIERQRSHPDNIQIEYDIMGSNQNEPSHVTSDTGSSLLSSQDSPIPMYDPRSGVIDNYLPENDISSQPHDVPRPRTSNENGNTLQAGRRSGPTNVECNTRPPFCSPFT